VNFVVDTWVLHKASEGNNEAINVLYNIATKYHKVFVDKAGEILKEYRSVNNSFVSRWLILISSRGIIKVAIKKRCKNILGCRRDMKFVYVCINCNSVRTIVSEDYHFTKNSSKLLKIGIKLLTLVEAAEVSAKQN
jgi:arginyl-tRNA--protein-N-Asp/Glu arginylyltransferase